MTATSGDNIGAAGRPAENPSGAAKTLIMRGNRIENKLILTK
jgi:hypothetical protein